LQRQKDIKQSWLRCVLVIDQRFILKELNERIAKLIGEVFNTSDACWFGSCFYDRYGFNFSASISGIWRGLIWLTYAAWIWLDRLWQGCLLLLLAPMLNFSMEPLS
jgi:hypothetical protein